MMLMIVCRPCLGREEVDVLGRNWPLGARFGPRRLRILFEHVLFYILRDAVACAQAQGTRTAAALVSKLQAAVAALLWPALPSPAQGT